MLLQAVAAIVEQHADERSAAETATTPCLSDRSAAAAADSAHSSAPVVANGGGGILDGSDGSAGAGPPSPLPSLDLEELGGTSERLDDAMRRWARQVCPACPHNMGGYKSGQSMYPVCSLRRP